MENLLPRITDWASVYSGRMIAAVLIFLIGRWLVKLITTVLVKVLEKNDVEITLVGFLKNIVHYALLIAVIIAALNQLGVNTASFLTVIGAAGLAIGLALKDSLSNFSAGVMLILFKPFKIGDFISAAGVSGSVKKITIFNTEMSTPDNQKVIVPNSSIMGSVITNVTANPTRRIDLVAGICYTDDLAKAKTVLEQIIADDPRILPEPAAKIALAELADSSINFVVRPWVKTEEYWDVRFSLTEQIKRKFDEAGLHIPYPQQDVHLFVEQKGE